MMLTYYAYEDAMSTHTSHAADDLLAATRQDFTKADILHALHASHAVSDVLTEAARQIRRLRRDLNTANGDLDRMSDERDAERDLADRLAHALTIVSRRNSAGGDLLAAEALTAWQEARRD